MVETTQITPFEVVRPLVTTEQAVEQWRLFEELKQSLLTDDDYATIQGKPYVKKSGFRKIAVFFGLSDSIISEDRVDRENGTFFWRIKVESRAPNGRTSVGVGICDSQERNFSHIEHDVYATAHTRAKNRAISDMVAGGLVSAEEMDPRPEKTTKTPPKPKKVEAESKVIEKEKPDPEPQPDPDEEKVVDTLLANDLKVNGAVTIYKYGKHIIVQPPQDIEQDAWNSYNGVLGRLLNADWNQKNHRWEVATVSDPEKAREGTR